MILSDKVAVVYGGGGAIGGAVARRFAREGATVYLAGRIRACSKQCAWSPGRSGVTSRVNAASSPLRAASSSAVVSLGLLACEDVTRRHA
jgi:NAD(P)-dependent dehydrogenase (short-subunit alcohol dehydrogenase family)